MYVVKPPRAGTTTKRPRGIPNAQETYVCHGFSSKNEMSILIQFSPSAHLVHILSDVHYKWALGEHYSSGTGSKISAEHQMCTGWARGDHWVNIDSGVREGVH